MDWMKQTFSTRPFREESDRQRTVAMKGAQMAVGQSRGAMPVPVGPAGVRGVDLARAGAAQGAAGSVFGGAGLRAGLDELALRNRLIAEEAQRRDRLAAAHVNAAGQAHGAGMQYANALAAKYLMPYADRFLSGLDNDPAGVTDVVDPRIARIGRTV
jgi:hypothetical protein